MYILYEVRNQNCNLILTVTHTIKIPILLLRALVFYSTFAYY